MNHRFVVALLFGALTLSPGFALAQGDVHSLEELVAGMAHTKAEHQALANHYAKEATDARAAAKRHQAMSRSYIGGVRSGGGSQPFATHCKSIAEKQEAIAAEFDALSKMHKEEAEKAK